MLIDELEKRSFLWDVFDKEYHNRKALSPLLLIHCLLLPLPGFSSSSFKTSRAAKTANNEPTLL